jgi:hypothetical protein
MMRCLVKAIACHGLGIHIYAGEDLPLEELPAKADKPAPKAKAETGNVATPPKMEGKEGPWQLSVTADPGTDIGSWAEIVIEATKLALEQCSAKAHVMEIFKVNRNIFDRMKADATSSHEELMSLFKERKESLAE